MNAAATSWGELGFTKVTIKGFRMDTASFCLGYATQGGDTTDFLLMAIIRIDIRWKGIYNETYRITLEYKEEIL